MCTVNAFAKTNLQQQDLTDPHFTTVPIKINENHKNGNINMEININVDFPQGDNIILVKKIAEWINNNFSNNLSDNSNESYTGSLLDGQDMIEYYKNAVLRDVSSSEGHDGGYWMNIHRISETNKFVSYSLAFSELDPGAATDVSYTEKLSFNKVNGEKVTWDIFASGYEQRLKELLNGSTFYEETMDGNIDCTDFVRRNSIDLSSVTIWLENNSMGFCYDLGSQGGRAFCHIPYESIKYLLTVEGQNIVTEETEAQRQAREAREKAEREEQERQAAEEKRLNDIDNYYSNAEIGDFFYSDGTYSKSVDGNKTIVGIVASNNAIEGKKRELSHGFIMAFQDASDKEVNWNDAVNLGENEPKIISTVSNESLSWCMPNQKQMLEMLTNLGVILKEKKASNSLGANLLSVYTGIVMTTNIDEDKTKMLNFRKPNKERWTADYPLDNQDSAIMFNIKKCEFKMEQKDEKHFVRLIAAF